MKSPRLIIKKHCKDLEEPIQHKVPLLQELAIALHKRIKRERGYNHIAVHAEVGHMRIPNLIAHGAMLDLPTAVRLGREVGLELKWAPANGDDVRT